MQDRSRIGLSQRTVRSYERYNGTTWVKKRISYPAGKAVPKRRLPGRSQDKNGERGCCRPVDRRPGHGKIPARRYRSAGRTT